MEAFIADLINNSNIPKFIRYLIVTILEIFLIGLFIVISINTEFIIGKILFIILSVLFLISYLYLILKIHKSK